MKGKWQHRGFPTSEVRRGDDVHIRTPWGRLRRSVFTSSVIPEPPFQAIRSGFPRLPGDDARGGRARSRAAIGIDRVSVPAAAVPAALQSVSMLAVPSNSSSRMEMSRMTNFWILPVTVMGNSETNLT